MALDRPLVRAPEFSSVEWLNTPAPPSLSELRGQVLLIEVWDFTCINCLRTLPTLRDWHRRYEAVGLVTLGVHTPEFPFARDAETVRRAVGRLGIRWPVALDNRQEIWSAFANRAWPTIYLIDRAGYIRFRREGEGGYFEIETAIRTLLVDSRSGDSALPPPLAPSAEASDGGICLPATAELQMEATGHSLPEDKATSLTIPDRRVEGTFYLEGEWRAVRRGAILESERGQIALPFQGSGVHAVMAPCGDSPGPRGEEGAWIEALLDGRSVPPGVFGQDLQLRQGGTWLKVDSPRTYDVLQSVEPGLHELRLRLASPGTTLYAFSFDPCFSPFSDSRSDMC
jgi:thiol-disulfide isomerase/thioredoxin